jgi:hypothetical protein
MLDLQHSKSSAHLLLVAFVDTDGMIMHQYYIFDINLLTSHTNITTHSHSLYCTEISISSHSLLFTLLFTNYYLCLNHSLYRQGERERERERERGVPLSQRSRVALAVLHRAAGWVLINH